MTHRQNRSGDGGTTQRLLGGPESVEPLPRPHHQQPPERNAEPSGGGGIEVAVAINHENPAGAARGPGGRAQGEGVHGDSPGSREQLMDAGCCKPSGEHRIQLRQTAGDPARRTASPTSLNVFNLPPQPRELRISLTMAPADGRRAFPAALRPALWAILWAARRPASPAAFRQECRQDRRSASAACKFGEAREIREIRQPPAHHGRGTRAIAH